MKLRLFSMSGLACVGLIAATPDAAIAGKRSDTALGVGLGALGGALLSNGDPWGAIGGAVAGGMIGNLASKDRHDRWDRRDRWRRDRDRHRDPWR
jgi:hypothetical protein